MSETYANLPLFSGTPDQFWINASTYLKSHGIDYGSPNLLGGSTKQSTDYRGVAIYYRATKVDIVTECWVTALVMPSNNQQARSKIRIEIRKGDWGQVAHHVTGLINQLKA